MKKYKRILLYALAFIFFAEIVIVFIQAETIERSQASPHVSVILYEGVSDRWTSLNQGIQQACETLGINTPIIKLSDRDTPDQQKEIIEREIADGVQGLLIAPGQSVMIRNYVKELPAQIPVVLLEAVPGEEDPELSAVTLDDVQMAGQLADGLIQDETSVILLKENMGHENLRLRYETFKAHMEASGIDVTEWESAGGDNTVDYLTGRLLESPRNAVVAFDPQTLEAAIDATQAAKARPRLYGIGSSEKILYYLDRQLVREICYGNEYGVGWNAMAALAQAMKLNPSLPLTDTDSFLVRKDNLYQKDVEQFLFPSIR